MENIPACKLAAQTHTRHPPGMPHVPAAYALYAVGGNHEAASHLWELYYGGWAAPNIYFLGFAGAVRFGGLRIAGLSGGYALPYLLFELRCGTCWTCCAHPVSMTEHTSCMIQCMHAPAGCACFWHMLAGQHPE